MAGVKISQLDPTFELNDTDTLPLARPGVGNGTTHKIYGSVFGKAADVTALQNNKVAKAGDTMTGKLTLDGDPTASLHAATKQYVDTRDGLKVSKSGDAMSGKLTLDGDPTAPLHAATKQYVDGTVSNAGFVELAGDTMTGKLTLDGDPTAPLHAATKQYVDGAVGSAVGSLGKTWADFKCS